jgi:hypothetical protein
MPLPTSDPEQVRLGSITPTLTRPHQGGGKMLMICEYRSAFAGVARKGSN